MIRPWAMLLSCFLSIVTELEAKDKLQIVVSFSILKDIVLRVAGDQATVVSIVGPNQDAHIFEPTPDTNRLILQADVVIINGLCFEKWVEKLIKATGYKKHIVIASQNIKPIILHQPQSSKNPMSDPHVWNSVGNVKIWVNTIQQALTSIDPHNATIYKKNAKAYLAELDRLEDWIIDQFKDISPKHRKIVTAHDAFKYYGEAYGIQFFSILGLTTETEPSAFSIAELIQQIRHEKIATVFVENMTNDRLIKQISKETGVEIGGILYSDALSLVGEPGETYIDMMKHNTRLFKEAMSDSNP